MKKTSDTHQVILYPHMDFEFSRFTMILMEMSKAFCTSNIMMPIALIWLNSSSLKMTTPNVKKDLTLPQGSSVREGTWHQTFMPIPTVLALQSCMLVLTKLPLWKHVDKICYPSIPQQNMNVFEVLLLTWIDQVSIYELFFSNQAPFAPTCVLMIINFWPIAWFWLLQ